jgi:putative addiction module killer protein
MEPDEVYDFQESDEFVAWVASFKDPITRARIERCLVRARRGNLGKAESIGDGVSEFKLDFGPGYRVYFFQIAPAAFRVLNGGDKSTQAADVRIAKALKSAWEEEHEN